MVLNKDKVRQSIFDVVPRAAREAKARSERSEPSSVPQPPPAGPDPDPDLGPAPAPAPAPSSGPAPAPAPAPSPGPAPGSVPDAPGGRGGASGAVPVPASAQDPDAGSVSRAAPARDPSASQAFAAPAAPAIATPPVSPVPRAPSALPAPRAPAASELDSLPLTMGLAFSEKPATPEPWFLEGEPAHTAFNETPLGFSHVIRRYMTGEFFQQFIRLFIVCKMCQHRLESAGPFLSCPGCKHRIETRDLAIHVLRYVAEELYARERVARETRWLSAPKLALRGPVRKNVTEDLTRVLTDAYVCIFAHELVKTVIIKSPGMLLEFFRKYIERIEIGKGDIKIHLR
jgi:hypothetical protein